MGLFKEELEYLVNRHGAEKSSNTPDFILAKFLDASLRAFETASVAREKWYGFELIPGEDRFKIEDLREFVGFLSGDVPELDAVEVPRLAESIDRWLAARRDRILDKAEV